MIVVLLAGNIDNSDLFREKLDSIAAILNVV